MDISNLSVKELESLHKKVAVEIEKRKQNNKADALKKLKKFAEESGYSLEELIGSKQEQRRTSKPVAVKYRHPNEGELTWTGRGKTPKWVAEWKSIHGSLDGLAVK